MQTAPSYTKLSCYNPFVHLSGVIANAVIHEKTIYMYPPSSGQPGKPPS